MDEKEKQLINQKIQNSIHNIELAINYIITEKISFDYSKTPISDLYLLDLTNPKKKIQLLTKVSYKLERTELPNVDEQKDTIIEYLKKEEFNKLDEVISLLEKINKILEISIRQTGGEGKGEGMYAKFKTILGLKSSQPSSQTVTSSQIESSSQITSSEDAIEFTPQQNMNNILLYILYEIDLRAKIYAGQYCQADPSCEKIITILDEARIKIQEVRDDIITKKIQKAWTKNLKTNYHREKQLEIIKEKLPQDLVLSPELSQEGGRKRKCNRKTKKHNKRKSRKSKRRYRHRK